MSSFEELSWHLPEVTDGKKKSLCSIRQQMSQSGLSVCGLRPHTQRKYECCDFWYVSSISLHHVNVQQTCSVFHVVGKLRENLVCMREREMQYKECGIKKCTYNYMFNFICVFVYILCTLEYNDNNENTL